LLIKYISKIYYVCFIKIKTKSQVQRLSTTTLLHKKNIERLKKLLKIITNFFSFQILIQAVDAFSGILIVRALSKVEYAYFGIASVMAVSIVNISIGGIGSYLISEGVRLKNYINKFSQLFADIEYFIAKKKWIVIGISIPLFCWLFIKNDLASFRLTFFLPLIVLDVLMRIRIQLYQAVFNLWEKYNTVQLITLCGSISRITLVVLVTFYPNVVGEFAYLGLLLSYAVQLTLFKKYCKPYILSRPPNLQERITPLNKLYYSQLPVNLYNYFDAQIVIFILTFLGSTSLLADVNAAGRLSLFVVAVNAFVNNFVIVQFAKIQNKIKFIKLLLFTSILFLLLYIIAILAIKKWPHPFIWLIGAKYSNIAPFLYLTVLVICIGNFSGFIYAVNYSKMWITKNWIAIPFTIFLQVVLLKYMAPKNFEQVWYFAMMCAIPTLCVNLFSCINGIRKMQHV